MKKLLFLSVAAGLFLGLSTADAGDHKLRAGGGLIFEDSTFGGGAAFDIAIGDRPIALTPFFEYYKESGVSSISAGADVLYKVPVADGKAEVYIGAGGGFYRASNGTSESSFLIDARAGLDYGITEVIGIYVEGKYLYSSKETAGVKVLDLNNPAAFVGISFKVGQ
jgi:hypothetical protein